MGKVLNRDNRSETYSYKEAREGPKILKIEVEDAVKRLKKD